MIHYCLRHLWFQCLRPYYWLIPFLTLNSTFETGKVTAVEQEPVVFQGEEVGAPGAGLGWDLEPLLMRFGNIVDVAAEFHFLVDIEAAASRLDTPLFLIRLTGVHFFIYQI